MSLPLYANPRSEKFVSQGDANYVLRADLNKAKNALLDYEEGLLREDPGDVEACWKASRAAWWVADHSEKHTDKLKYFQKGIDYAKQGLADHPNCVECHFWLGGNLGSFGETKGIMKSLFLVKPIRHEMAEVNRINDRFDGGGGYRVLGVVDYQVPGIAGGSKKRALEELNKSLAMDPLEPFTHYYLAEYFKTIGDKAKMQEEWKTLQTLKVATDNEPEWEMLLVKGKKIFE